MALTNTFAKITRHGGEPGGRKYSDGGGLYLHVMSSGKYWRLAYRFAGKQKTLALGVYPKVSLVNARKRRDKARNLLTEGVDPGTAKRSVLAATAVRASNNFEAKALDLMLDRLAVTYRHILPSRDHDDFYAMFVEPHLRNEKNGEQLHSDLVDAEQFTHKNDKPLSKGDVESTVRWLAFNTACAFFAKAVLASARKDSESALLNVIESATVLGFLDGRLAVRTALSPSLAALKSRHAENRAMKADAFAWLDINMAECKSMNSAAAQIVIQQPVKLSTARDWVGDWKKQRCKHT